MAALLLHRRLWRLGTIPTRESFTVGNCGRVCRGRRVNGKLPPPIRRAASVSWLILHSARTTIQPAPTPIQNAPFKCPSLIFFVMQNSARGNSQVHTVSSLAKTVLRSFASPPSSVEGFCVARDSRPFPSFPSSARERPCRSSASRLGSRASDLAFPSRAWELGRKTTGMSKICRRASPARSLAASPPIRTTVYSSIGTVQSPSAKNPEVFLRHHDPPDCGRQLAPKANYHARSAVFFRQKIPLLAATGETSPASQHCALAPGRGEPATHSPDYQPKGFQYHFPPFFFMTTIKLSSSARVG